MREIKWCSHHIWSTGTFYIYRIWLCYRYVQSGYEPIRCDGS